MFVCARACVFDERSTHTANFSWLQWESAYLEISQRCSKLRLVSMQLNLLGTPPHRCPMLRSA